MPDEKMTPTADNLLKGATDHTAALKLANIILTNPTDRCGGLARAYIDLHDKSRHLALLQINPEAERVVTLLKDQEAELADLRAIAEAAETYFQDDPKFFEGLDPKWFRQQAAVRIALTKWRTRTEKP